MAPKNGSGRKPDQRTVASSRGLGIPLPSKPLSFPPFERAPSDIADVETAPIDAVLALAVPTHQCVCKSREIEPALGLVSIRQAQRHAGIVGPLAGRQTEWATTDHVCNLALTAALKLQCGPHRITDCQAQQCALCAVECLFA
ncbi:hypothetical protein D3C79_818220 [compost metagenome]